MAESMTSIKDVHEKFIRAQSMFFVASAPLDPEGRVNVSPKGLDTFRILGPTTVAYLDLTGSGVETIAHLRENGRIVLMFCAFQGPPNILRLHGRGRVVEPSSAEFHDLAARFPTYLSTRSIIVVEISRVSDSCGYGVPLLKYEGERSQLRDWARKKGPEGLVAYRREKNRVSIDGLSGVE
jgi:predicted pyridoxine 5'-phosphate oxidase superfamily flavin-nucleotide-binding protein